MAFAVDPGPVVDAAVEHPLVGLSIVAVLWVAFREIAPFYRLRRRMQ